MDQTTAKNAFNCRGVQPNILFPGDGGIPWTPVSTNAVQVSGDIVVCRANAPTGDWTIYASTTSDSYAQAFCSFLKGG